MRLLCLDIGEKRIGVAVSDPARETATPVAVLEAARVMGDGRDLVRLVEDYEVEQVVIGLPLSLDGTEGPQAARVRSAAKRLERYVSLPMVFSDERLSSAEAGGRLREAGASERDQRGMKDMVAAAVILQRYLDAHSEASAETPSADG